MQLADGSLSLPITGGSNFGATVSTAHIAGGWHGTAFGGGAFFQASIKFTPTLGSSNLPFPGFWFESIDFLANLPTRQWQGQAVGYIQRVELDAMQWPHNADTLFSGVELLEWSGPGSSNSVTNLSGVSAVDTVGTLNFATVGSQTILVGAFVTISSSAPGGTGSIVGFSNPTPYKVLATNGKTSMQLGTVAGGAIVTTVGTLTGYAMQINVTQQPTPDVGGACKISQNPLHPVVNLSDFNLFGCLWIPATATTQGRLVTYLNGSPVAYVGVHPAPNTVWNQYNPATPPPSIIGDSAGSVLDVSQMVAIFGTDVTCPMVIQSFEVWQGSGVNNITQ